jgi:hypothetical protein
MSAAIAFATCTEMPDGAADDDAAAALLGAERVVWSDPAVDWTRYDRVVVRSTWDYSRRLAEFLTWCDQVGSERLRNSPETIAWNADKRYLGGLDAPTVPTVFVAPGDPIPALDGELVVKPNVSAGARHTGRFGAGRHDEAAALIATIQSSGRTALVQPYQPSVDARGETALVFLGGELSHALRKRAVLSTEGVAPTTPDGLRVATVMLEPDLVAPTEPLPAELALAERVIDEVTARFGSPLYARVDLVQGADGAPMVLELEMIEPALYLGHAPGSSDRLAAAIRVS